ncbi:hypothetical protein G436_2813 [Leptospira interrogans serovar Hardjo str. Norma]|uniref:Uncharacterized protein n=1 Tax=Leptospira interrogans serovar Hardjo str. Norma TaxID=1279460 RepID=A0A0M3TM03_LEPIR|nr:hypothetical protein G436_2813 [Leptospira interrogans serovar Hardjo str. Norma]
MQLKIKFCIQKVNPTLQDCGNSHKLFFIRKYTIFVIKN